MQACGVARRCRREAAARLCCGCACHPAGLLSRPLNLMALAVVSMSLVCTSSSAFRKTSRPGRAAMAALVAPSPPCVACARRRQMGGRVGRGGAAAVVGREERACGTCRRSRKPACAACAARPACTARRSCLPHIVEALQHVVRLPPALDVAVQVEACSGWRYRRYRGAVRTGAHGHEANRHASVMPGRLHLLGNAQPAVEHWTQSQQRTPPRRCRAARRTPGEQRHMPGRQARQAGRRPAQQRRTSQAV